MDNEEILYDLKKGQEGMVLGLDALAGVLKEVNDSNRTLTGYLSKLVKKQDDEDEEKEKEDDEQKLYKRFKAQMKKEEKDEKEKEKLEKEAIIEKPAKLPEEPEKQKDLTIQAAMKKQEEEDEEKKKEYEEMKAKGDEDEEKEELKACNKEDYPEAKKSGDLQEFIKKEIHAGIEKLAMQHGFITSKPPIRLFGVDQAEPVRKAATAQTREETIDEMKKLPYSVLRKMQEDAESGNVNVPELLR